MTNPLNRGEVWLADLNPTQGSEQAGTRPVIIFQNNLVSQFSTTTITIPLTTNQRRAALPLPVRQHCVAADGREISVKRHRLSAAAQQERYPATSSTKGTAQLVNLPNFSAP
ncbi:MAG: type II toxin-antitoxin system PemK/MazF family toxin [Leptolyngbyaceae cyanobacterium SM2_5_2]|nr:type II toxin-antitoxin system PemK/MazF family toxin [Leptolyngbyaceae cyanobacterium SM2_5_2]